MLKCGYSSLATVTAAASKYGCLVIVGVVFLCFISVLCTLCAGTAVMW